MALSREEQTMLDEAVRRALAEATDAASADAALGALGWGEMLATEAADSIPIVFTALGYTNAASTALADVWLSALGIADRLVPFPAFGSTAAGDTGLWFASRATHGIPLDGIDPALSLVTVAAAPADGTLHGWDGAVACAQRAVSYQLIGASRVMLDLAREHAIGRRQFDRPVASFQAVRHRLAEALVAIESAADAVAVASASGDLLASALARSLAGRAARTAAAQSQQVLAGIGFTTEHRFHHYLRRTMALDGLFGSPSSLARSLGAQLLRDRNVPKLIEL